MRGRFPLDDSFCFMQSRSRDELHHSELSLIAKDEPPLVVEIEDRVRVLGHIVLRGQIKELACHAQMDRKDAIRIKLDQNVLTAAIDRFNEDALDFAIELSGLEGSY